MSSAPARGPGRPPDRDPRDPRVRSGRRRGRRRRGVGVGTGSLVVAACVAVVVGVLGLGVLLGQPEPSTAVTGQPPPGPGLPGADPATGSTLADPSTAPPTAPPDSSPDSSKDGSTDGVRSRSPQPVRLLRAWDARRAEAWAMGSPRALRRLYVADAGRADVALLRAYRARNLRVEEMEAQLLAVEVLDRSPASWTLRVTDRLRHAVAVRGARRVSLPRDRPSVREVTLTRVEGAWRVAEVSAPGRRR